MGMENRAALAGVIVLLAIIIGGIILAAAVHGTRDDTAPVITPTTVPSPSGTIAGNQIPVHQGSFEFRISPMDSQAKPGESITYVMDILPSGGFNDTVHVTLVVSALFVTRNYDLGTYEPPYPRRIEYPLTVPSSIPSGITLEGKITADGGEIQRKETIHLRVG
ncbi:MAG: hypothetical protein LUQ40_04750 [Methanomicrobiales archaeon]|nr:hypothetical protein [Methanomicrobiales archaeon]